MIHLKRLTLIANKCIKFDTVLYFCNISMGKTFSSFDTEKNLSCYRNWELTCGTFAVHRKGLYIRSIQENHDANSYCSLNSPHY